MGNARSGRIERFLDILAGFVARRRLLFIGVWLVLFIVAVPLAATQTSRLSGSGWDVPGSSAALAMERLKEFPGREGEPLAVFVQGTNNAAVDDRLEEVATELRRYPRLLSGGPVQRFDGGRAALVPLRAVEQERIFDFAAELRRALVADRAGVSTRVVGEAAMWSNFQEVSRKQAVRAETVSFPLMLLILLAAFGTLLAALTPIALGLVAVAVTGAAIYFLAGSFEISIYVTNIASMVGIGVAVDYCLFVVASYRARLRAGCDGGEALRGAFASAGTAVVYSGATVIVSLASLLFVNVNAIRSMAAGAIIVVGVAVLATATLLPALLALAGPRIERLRIRFPQCIRRRHVQRRHVQRRLTDGDGGFWVGWAGMVMRRPVAFLAAGVAVLLLAASPLLSIHTRNGALDQLPPDAEVRLATGQLTALAGPGALGMMELVVSGKEAADRIAADVGRLDGVAAVAPPVAFAGHYLVEVTPAADPESDQARALLATVTALSGKDADIGGTTSFEVAMDRAIFGDLWKIVLFILVFSYLVLIFLFRSVLLPLKAVMMNILSVGVAYGVLVAIFQWGWLDWLGFSSPGYIDSIVPVLLLAIVFGLSMDYEVFLLTRIRERYLAGADNATAVGQGLAASARTITVAALIMVTVFGSFAFAGGTSPRELGVGLATAILVDATIVRLVVVPAMMKLLGDWNWWFPTRWTPAAGRRIRADEPASRVA
ncbi:MMPL family transporter [Frankia sp. Cas3]|uniref:MMPL family transporter n=1 Tax=Frankia sp. Cas3 TaxID=3073926 RepID=UPI002AD4A584|nr:MMPL family transporter [Frankia sp. Cas3]